MLWLSGGWGPHLETGHCSCDKSFDLFTLEHSKRRHLKIWSSTLLSLQCLHESGPTIREDTVESQFTERFVSQNKPVVYISESISYPSNWEEASLSHHLFAFAQERDLLSGSVSWIGLKGQWETESGPPPPCSFVFPKVWVRYQGPPTYMPRAGTNANNESLRPEQGATVPWDPG